MRQSIGAAWRKICAGAAAACISFNMVPGIPAKAGENDTAMGRYLESDVALPEDIYALDIVRTAENTLRIVGQDSDGIISMWDSSDGGENWEQTGVLPEEYADYYLDIELDPQGGGAGVMMSEVTEDAQVSGDAEEAQASDGAEEAQASGGTETAQAADGVEDSTEAADMSVGRASYEYSLVSFDVQGNTQQAPLSDGLGFLHFTQSGDLLYWFYSSGVCVLDPATGEVLRTITQGNVDSIGSCGKEALLLTESEVQRYDYTTGEPLLRDEALEDALYGDGVNYMAVTSHGGPIATAEDDEGRLYYATQKGIFSHVMEGSVVEQVVDGSLNSLGDPNTYFMGLAVLDQVFYVLTVDDNTAGGNLLKYEYHADVSSIPAKELTVYSLRENDAIRQAAVLFQKKNPDVYVNYQVGMSGTDGVTASDALRTLNTDILAGNGPDVLILDEMSVETYTEQGLLMDLDSVVSEISDSDGFLENIVDAYRTEELLPAVPSRFGLLVAAGEPELISTINGLDSIAELAASADVMDPYDVVNIGEILYQNCAGSWKNEDNTINQEKLAGFVTGVRRVSDAYQENASEKAKEELSMYADGWEYMEEYNAGLADDIAMGIMDLAAGEIKVKLGVLNDIIDYSGLVSVNGLNGACQETLLSAQQENVFVPFCTLGVLNTAKNQEIACDFVRYMLSEEGLSQNQGWGFPVNTKAFETEIYTDQFGEGGSYVVSSSGSDGNDYMELTYVWPTKEESDALYEMAKQADTCADTERVKHDVIMEEVNRCISGETSVDEAVNAIMQKLNLYLAE